MAYRLIKFSPHPPGEFPYKQSVDGKVISWPGDGFDIKQQAQRISKFRKANNLPRSSIPEVVEDLDLYTCQRLGNSPKWCREGSGVQVYATYQKAPGGCCGAKL